MKHSRLVNLASTLLAFDSETVAINQAVDDGVPELVLGSAASSENGVLQGVLLDRDQTLDAFAEALDDGETVLGFANGSFDVAVFLRALDEAGIDAWGAVFDLYDQDRVYDLLMAEALNAIANGHLGKDPATMQDMLSPKTGKQTKYYSLDLCLKHVRGRADAKVNDTYRLRYGEFRGVPLAELPPEAAQYPVDDAVNQGETILAQAGLIEKVSVRHEFGPNGICALCETNSYTEVCWVRRKHRNLHDLGHKVRAAFALHLGTVAGFDVDQSKVDVIERHALRDRDAGLKPFQVLGLVREDGSCDQGELKRRIAVAYGCEEICSRCSGTRRMPAPKQRLRGCTACRGFSSPEKKDGPSKREWALLNPLGCDLCSSTGKIPDPKHTVSDSECDGTGFRLTTNVPRSEAGGIAYGRDSLGESGDEDLMAYAGYLEDQKKLTTYIPFFRSARQPVAGHAAECPHPADRKELCTCPGPYRAVRIHPRYRLPLETGRVSSESLVQLLPREPGYVDLESGEYVPSFRECVVPPVEEIEVEDDYVLQEGEVFCDED